MRKKSNKTYKKQCDKLWADIIKLRAKNKCEMCRRVLPLQAHHIFGRKAMSTRYDLENGVALCFNCHYNEAEQNSTKFGLWIIEKRGREWFDELNRRHNQIKKVDWEAMTEYLEREYKNAGKTNGKRAN